MGDLGSIPGLGDPLGGGHGTLLQYSCQEDPMVGYSPWGHKELDMTEQLGTSDVEGTLNLRVGNAQRKKIGSFIHSFIQQNDIECLPGTKYHGRQRLQSRIKILFPQRPHNLMKEAARVQDTSSVLTAVMQTLLEKKALTKARGEQRGVIFEDKCFCLVMKDRCTLIR